MAKLKKHGKGIVLMHDFQHATAEAAPALLDQLKANGYKIVFMKAEGAPVRRSPPYDELGRQGPEAADRQRPPDLERGAHDQRVNRSAP